MHEYTHVCKYTHTYFSTYIYKLRTQTRQSFYMCIYVYIYTYVLIYTHTYTYPKRVYVHVYICISYLIDVNVDVLLEMHVFFCFRQSCNKRPTLLMCLRRSLPVLIYKIALERVGFLMLKTIHKILSTLQESIL